MTDVEILIFISCFPHIHQTESSQRMCGIGLLLQRWKKDDKEAQQRAEKEREEWKRSARRELQRRGPDLQNEIDFDLHFQHENDDEITIHLSLLSSILSLRGVSGDVSTSSITSQPISFATSDGEESLLMWNGEVFHSFLTPPLSPSDNDGLWLSRQLSSHLGVSSDRKAQDKSLSQCMSLVDGPFAFVVIQVCFLSLILILIENPDF